MDNDIQFQREGRSYVAEIQIIDTSVKKTMFGDEDHNAPKRELDQAYPIIYSLIKPAEGKKGSKMNLNVLRFHIEEIYSLRFVKDTKALANPDESEVESFQEFFANFMIQKYKKRDTLEQVTINILSSIEFYSRQYKDIRIFARFLREDYDTDDLIYFLFVRSCIEKELKVLFVEKMRHATNGQLDDATNVEIFVPLKSSARIGQLVFGRSDERMLDIFNSKVAEIFKKEAVGPKKDMIRAYSILAFAVDDYHNKEEKDANGPSSSEFNSYESKKSQQQAPAPVKEIKTEEDEIPPGEEEEEKVPTQTPTEKKAPTPTVKKTPAKPAAKGSAKTTAKTTAKTAAKTTGKAAPKSAKPKTSASPVKKPASSPSKKPASSPSKKPATASQPPAERSELFMDILKKTGASRCKSDGEKNTSLKAILSNYLVEKELSDYIQRMVDSNPNFSKNEEKINKNMGKIKTFIQQKINLLTSLLFTQDKKKFLSTLAMKENNTTGGKYFSTLTSMKDHMIKTTPFSNLDEAEVIRFLKATSDIPELVQMVNKHIAETIKK
ncbi:MAG: hypothetical protein MJ252_27330 [archaeon]|nr:hypothetical protein [archaeon]